MENQIIFLIQIFCVIDLISIIGRCIKNVSKEEAKNNFLNEIKGQSPLMTNACFFCSWLIQCIHSILVIIITRFLQNNNYGYMLLGSTYCSLLIVNLVIVQIWTKRKEKELKTMPGVRLVNLGWTIYTFLLTLYY